jgi:hypothetical protein
MSCSRQDSTEGGVHEVRHVQNGKPPYRYGGQVNKNKNKDGDRQIYMAVKLRLKYTI